MEYPEASTSLSAATVLDAKTLISQAQDEYDGVNDLMDRYDLLSSFLRLLLLRTSKNRCGI